MMSEDTRPKSNIRNKGVMMALGFAGLLIVFAYVALQELR